MFDFFATRLTPYKYYIIRYIVSFMMRQLTLNIVLSSVHEVEIQYCKNLSTAILLQYFFSKSIAISFAILFTPSIAIVLAILLPVLIQHINTN